MSTPQATQASIKAALIAEARRLGFTYCGFATAGILEPEARYLERWLAEGRHGQMAYMADTFDTRIDARKLLPGAKTMISLLMGYYPPEDAPQPPGAPKIARYARGKDYHHVLRERTQQLIQKLYELCGDVGADWFVDAAPVMEKAWATRAGLGWIGKNTNLIRPDAGSYFLLAEVITDVALPPDSPIKDFCGTCTKCLDACPTEALTPYQIDANKCISYLTIELKDRIPDTFRDKLAGWAFGCDICQEVCPWNRFSQAHDEPFFRPLPHASLTAGQWRAQNNSQYKRHTRATPLSRIRRPNWLDNIDAAEGA